MTTGLAIANDDDYSDTVTTDNVVREIAAVGKTWKVYVACPMFCTSWTVSVAQRAV